MARLTKTLVAPGIVWVEAPEAGFRLLCGCPGDAVKHLIRHGLIREDGRDGVGFETGPNAILLSDLPEQNGMLCNLAEFPVMQMLYRQGRIMPGHPNNDGRRPLLIGDPDQLEAQLRYIFLGHYGLADRGDLIAAGVVPALVDDLMAMKLKFSFGRIRPTAELLEAVPLTDQAAALPGGVTLKRTGINQFVVAFGAESVAVDLRLAPGEVCPPSFTLPRMEITRDAFSIVHLGDGDGWDVDRPCMSSLICFGGRLYLIDAGPHIARCLAAVGLGVDDIDGLFQTHCHDDHFAGLPDLMCRRRPLAYFAAPLVRVSTMRKLAALLGTSEVEATGHFVTHDLGCDLWNDVEGLEVMPMISPHPVETTVLLFRTRWLGTYRSYAHFADIVSLGLLAAMVTEEGGGGISRAFYDKVVETYAIPADVKKIDIGGGLIHGVAEDFRRDRSRRLLLSHRAGPLLPGESEIGSAASFGSQDVIIAGSVPGGVVGAAAWGASGPVTGDARQKIGHG
jgi:hemerythrin